MSSNDAGRGKDSSSALEKESGWRWKEDLSNEQPWHGMGSYKSGEDWKETRRPKNKARAMSKGTRGFEAAMVEAGEDIESRERQDKQRSLSENREAFNKDLDDCLKEETST